MENSNTPENIFDKYFWIHIQDKNAFTQNYPVSEILQKAEKETTVPVSDLKLKSQLLNPKEFPEKLGFTADPKIGPLVAIFNALGIKTVNSCEGHPDHGDFCPTVSFNVTDIYSVLSVLKNWPEIQNPAVIMRALPTTVPQYYKKYFDLGFNAHSLTESQELMQQFTDFLTKKIKN